MLEPIIMEGRQRHCQRQTQCGARAPMHNDGKDSKMRSDGERDSYRPLEWTVSQRGDWPPLK